MLYEIKENKQYGSFEVYFSEKPNEETRTAMKNNKMRWNPKKCCWYGFIEKNKLESILKNDDALAIPEATFVDGDGLYDGWEGGNNTEWHSEKELKSKLAADFKKAGIKATIKFNKAGYLTAITCTLTIKADDIKSREEWEEFNKINFNGWNYYTDENGNIKDIYGEELDINPESSEQLKLQENIKETNYNLTVKHLTGNTHMYDELNILKGKAKRDYDVMRKIVASYNRDCSNATIDYFERDIYDDYRIKIA